MAFLLLDASAMALIASYVKPDVRLFDNTSPAGNGLVRVPVSDTVYAILDDMRRPGENDSEAFLRLCGTGVSRTLQ
jgi:hypothetical protein